MNRKTEYIKGYGYVTQAGDGLLDNIVDGIKTIVMSDAVKDAGKEAFKAGAKSAGDKLGTKLVEKAFAKKEKVVERLPRLSKSDSNAMLKQIYGESLFKPQKGKGLRRI